MIDGRAVSQEALAAAIADVRVAIDELRASGALTVQPTFFEVTTAVAFELFRRAKVDAAVLERVVAAERDPTQGARPLRRAYERLVEAPPAARMLSVRVREGGALHVSLGRDGAVEVNLR